MSFIEVLADKGIINQYQIDDIMEKASELDGDTDDALSALGIDEEKIREAKSEYYGIPSKILDPKDLATGTMSVIPEDSARHYKSIAFHIEEDGTVHVGVVDPGDIEVKNALQFIFGEKNTPYQTFVISNYDFKEALKNYTAYGYSSSSEESDEESSSTYNSTHEAEVRSLEDIISQGSENENGEIVEDAPATKAVAVILKNAIEGKASDVHIEHTQESVKVRFRVDGDLHTSLILRKDLSSAIVARIKILAKLKLDEKRKPQDGRFPAIVGAGSGKRKIDFRVSTMPTFFGEKVVIRILDPGKGLNDLSGTGMSARQIEIVKRATSRPYGMILVTGPTGSGKSTTLRSMLKQLDREGKNVVSLEDPIEYNIDGVSQSQVRPEIGYTFANGLRSILRQDPDIIMVGEIRDKETAQLAIQAALTGHLVLSTLHTNTAIGAIPRLVDMGVDPYLIAPTLVMIMAQRLGKRIARGAAGPIALDGGKKMIVEEQFSDMPANILSTLDIKNTVTEPISVPHAPGGTSGRLGIFEMFEIDKEIERQIIKDPTEQKIYAIARSKGMLMMKDDAILKSMAGKLPWSEVNKV